MSKTQEELIKKDIAEYVAGMSIHGRIYTDSRTGQFVSFDTGKVFPKKKMNALLKNLDRLNASIRERLNNGNTFQLIVIDYFPDMAIGKMERSEQWIYNACMATPFYRRNASDQTVIHQKERIVDSIISLGCISEDIESGKINQVFPPQWYQDCAFLHGHSKTIESENYGERTAIHNGMFLLLKAREDGRPTPSRLEIWLAMNPIELFTTAEGRAERDRQAARFRSGKTSL